MGNSNNSDFEQQQSAGEIHKKKLQVQFRQNDFIRQIQGSIQTQYQILSPYLRTNEFYQLRKAIHLSTKLIRSVYIINKYKVRSTQRVFLQDQIHKLKQIDHPNVNKIYELFKDSHRFYIVMELCYGESLAEMIDREKYVEERRAAEIMRQVFNVLGHCHRRGIYHTDLKLENIIFNSQKQDVVKIADFSISRIFRIEDIIEQSKGKAFLSSPQSLRNQSGPKSDIWQCGVILYILLSGQCPFIGTKKNILAKRLMYYVPTFTQKRFQNVSRQARQFLKNLLKVNPNDRYSAQMCMQSKWIKTYYKQPLISTINLSRCLLECYHFNPSSKLQQATWTFFVNALVPFCEKQNILYVFNRLDQTGKGELAYQEIFNGFNQIYENRSKAKFLTEFLFNRLKKTKIMFSHFVTIATNRMFLVTDSNIKKIFQVFDDDGSGQISVHQLKQVLGSSKQVTEDVWLQLMKQADANSDGMISFEEFSDMMKSLLNKQNQELFQLVQNQSIQSQNSNFGC